MKKILFLIILLFIVGCGSNNKNNDFKTSALEESEEVNQTIIDNNLSDKNISSLVEDDIDVSENNITDTNDTLDDNEEDEVEYSNIPYISTVSTKEKNKSAKAQLGVIANATVNIYELDENFSKKLIVTDKTSLGDTIETIGNFNIETKIIDTTKLYLIEVVGGDDFDVEDDGVINISPTPNRGRFYLLARGDTLLESKNINITIVSEIVYQTLLDDLNSSSTIAIEDRLDSISKEIVEKDINGDGVVDMIDILNYNPILDKKQLSLKYRNGLDRMVDNVLHNRAIDFIGDIPIPTDLLGKYSKTEEGIQEALDSADYDYVIYELLINRDDYNLSDDEVYLNVAGAYVGKGGYSVFDITSAMAGSSGSLNGFVFNTTKDNDALYTINQLKEADRYYTKVIDGADCSNVDTLTEEQKSACYDLGLVRLTSLSNSVKLLFGGDEEIVKSWAEGVDINSSDDLNGNGVIDSADASACAIVYASNPSDSCRDGSMATYRKKVTFTKDGLSYDTTLIDVDVGNPNLGYTTFKKLITNGSSPNSAVLTDGVCDVNFNKTTNEVDGVTYFPCPVINDGVLMNIADSLSVASGIQNLFPIGSETRETIESYIENITGSPDGTLTQDDLGIYLQSH